MLPTEEQFGSGKAWCYTISAKSPLHRDKLGGGEVLSKNPVVLIQRSTETSSAGSIAPDWRRNLRPRHHLLLLPLVLLLPLSGCAGYQLGNGTLYRPDIRTVHVPVFQSDTFRRNLGEQLTEMVVKELELHSPYKVVDDPLVADTVLTGRIISERKRVLTENRNDEPRDIETDLVVQVNWYDRRGEAVMQDACFSLAQQGFSISQSTDFIPEAGQSIATAQQEAFRRIARQIVSQMEAPW